MSEYQTCSENPLPLKTIHELYNYNYWARDLQLGACAALTAEQFNRPMGGSFSSVRDTLAHLMDNEAYYLHRWRGCSREQIVTAMGSSRVEDRAKLWREQFPTLPHLERRWHEVEREVRAYLDTLSQSDLVRKVTYVDSHGEPWRYALWHMLLHVVNHQTYHRGQVTVLLRQLGASAPPTDFLAGVNAGFGTQVTLNHE